MLKIDGARRLIGFAAGVLLASALAFGLAAPAQAASCGGNSHKVALSNGTVSPGNAVTGSVFTFSVTVTDNKGCVPSSVSVAVAGFGTYGLTATGANYASGVVFRRGLVLSPGTHAYTFTVVSGTGPGRESVTLTTVSPSAAVVTSAPTPTPAPTPRPTPTPKPLPVATPRPTTKPRPTATPTATRKPGAKATPKPGSKAMTKPSSSSGTTGAGSSPGALGSAEPGSSNDPITAGGFILPGGQSGAPGSSGPLGGSGSGGSLPIGVAMVVLSALGFIGIVAVARRRSDADEPELEALPIPVSARHAPTLVLVPPGTPPEEVDIPRWRRPSLRQARAREIRVGYASPPVPIIFHGDGSTGLERRVVRYRLVRLSSIPDEIMGEEVGRLDSGDEVDVVRSAGEYLLVRTPHGAEGWVHRMTLGEGPQAAEA